MFFSGILFLVVIVDISQKRHFMKGKETHGIGAAIWRKSKESRRAISRIREDDYLLWLISNSVFTFMHWRRKWQPTPVFLPGESQGRGSLVGCRLWGRTVGHDWSNLAAAPTSISSAPVLVGTLSITTLLIQRFTASPGNLLEILFLNTSPDPLNRRL